MRRRDLITLLGGAAAAWSAVARAQQQTMPVIGHLNSESPDLAAVADRLRAYRQGLSETGYVEGGNVAIEYRWAHDQNDRLPAMAADLVDRKVTVIAANGAAAVAAKSATTTIPIVFETGGDPVNLGFVASLNRPGGNMTGVSFLINGLGSKRLQLLRELVPTAETIGFLVDPTNPNTESETSDMLAAAHALGRKLLIVKASTEQEIDAAFAILVARFNQFERILRFGSIATVGDGGNHGWEGHFGKEARCEAERRGTRAA